ncbi:hypothetical protein BKA70DRAFT_1251338 [Coprinopsis sp. MPI-PUGE-AT-0042]|nr:hypothetical protein BKA70DRAFT_1251338 [Coprinopsis sp. MPI-PUGE-AT-0042]
MMLADMRDFAISLKASLAESGLVPSTGLSTWAILLAILLPPAFLMFSKLFGTSVPQENGLENGHTDAKTQDEGPLDVRVSCILLHPIKSCKGISVQQASFTPEGLEFDRIWAIIDVEKNAIITARTVAKMVLITPNVERDDSLPHLGSLNVLFPEDSGAKAFSIPLRPTEDILSKWQSLPEVQIWPTHGPVDGYICESLTPDGPSPSSELSKYMGKEVHLVYKGPSPRNVDTTVRFPELKATAKYQDMYPLLVLSEESISPINEELRKHVGTQGIKDTWKTDSVVIERFRPNIVFSGGGPFAEDGWEEITIGSETAPAITLVSKCTRCLLPNVSPESGVRDAAVPYKVLMKFRTGLDPTHKMKPCVGCNGVPDRAGVIKVGDKVYVKKTLSGL